MNVNSTTSVTSITNGLNTTNAATGSSQTLTQKDFLQLLVSQMQNQNPLDPQSNTQMAADMAQFTALQQSSSMSSSLSMMQASSLIGNTVNLQVDANTITSGVVQGVALQNGTPQILVNGATYNLNQLIGVSPTVVSPTAGTSGSTTP